MDNQLALMKKLQKDHDTIAYAHNEEIVLIKRVVGDDGVYLTEVTLDTETGSKISERNIPDYEMKLADFDSMKQLLTEETRQSSTLISLPKPAKCLAIQAASSRSDCFSKLTALPCPSRTPWSFFCRRSG